MKRYVEFFLRVYNATRHCGTCGEIKEIWMTLRYKENGIYIAECNICRCVLGAEKNNQTEMELFLKNNGWKIWKSNNVHQPNCICYNCKSVVDSLVNK